MAKAFKCEMCGEVITAPSVEELLPKIKAHAKEHHNMTEISSDMMKMMRSNIFDA